MGIVLIVAILVVAVAVLYVTATISTRTRQSTAPVIDDAFKGVSGQIDAANQNLSQRITAELQEDREQLLLDGRKIQGRLDHLDSRASSMTNQVLAELDTIRRLVEQLAARQDQLGADLGKLDHQVTRLGESLARPSASPVPAVQAPPQQAAAARPPAGPGQLYAERLQFAFVRVQPESSSAQSERQYRIHVERRIAAMPSPQPGALNDPPAIIQRAAHDEGFRKRLSEAASDSAAKLGDPAFAAVTERWVTQDAYPETALVGVCNRIGGGLSALAEKPLEKTGTELRLPGPLGPQGPQGPEAATATGTGAALILRPVTEPLGQAAAFLEITGVVVGTATGLHPLALVAAKMLARDQFHDFVARRLIQAARLVFNGPEGPAEDPQPLSPVAQAAETRAPAAPAPGPLWGPPSASRPPPTHPQPSPKPPERQPDAAHPDWWDDRPTAGGPGSG